MNRFVVRVDVLSSSLFNQPILEQDQQEPDEKQLVFQLESNPRAALPQFLYKSLPVFLLPLSLP